MDIKGIKDISSVMSTLKDSSSKDDVEELKSIAHDDKVSKEDKIKAVGKQFEKIFLTIVMKSMRDTVKSSDLFGKGMGEDIYQSMLDDEYVSQASKSLSLGFAEAFTRKLNNYKK